MHNHLWSTPVSLIAFLAGVFMSFILCVPAFAYQSAGHFYSVYAVAVSTTHLTASEQRLLAFCAQLPDQSRDLDAVTVYKTVVLKHPVDWVTWATFNRVSSSATAVRQMITVQQQLHVLTGGNADDVRAMARNVVGLLTQQVTTSTDRRTAICALGFGFHMLGDSYAHQRMEEDLESMYPTGRGHAADFSYPDYPLCDGLAHDAHVTQTCTQAQPKTCTPDMQTTSRYCRWTLYPPLGASLLSDSPDSRAVQNLFKDLAELSQKASDLNQWGEGLAEAKLLADEDVPPKFETFFKNHASSQTCQIVLTAAETELQISSADEHANQTIAPLSCQRVWNAFSGVMTGQMKSSESAGKRIREKLGALSWDSLYVCPVVDATNRGPASAGSSCGA
jgi:hypothetical protein